MKAKISFGIGVVTMTFSMLIYELSPLWLILDLFGMILAYIGLRNNEEECKAGLILCFIAGLFSFSAVALVYLI